MQEEIWKDMPEYEGLYQVSNLGRVKSLARKVWNGKVFYISKEKVLKCKSNKAEYNMVSLRIDNKTYNKKVHQLVAMSFLNHKPCGYKIVVDHKNNNPLDNRVENLQLITQRENASKDRKGISKYTGVYWVKSRNKWTSTIQIKGKSKHLGMFTSELEAHEAYQSELKEILINK